MANRFCVLIDGLFIPINEEKEFIRFSTNGPRRIGDDAMALFEGNPLPVEKKVRYLKSSRMFKNATYLVDLDKREAWAYKI
jgi:hypothetical protein